MMQVAYLIAVHHQPEHLRRLVERLSAPWATFCVHVDAKVDIAPFTAALPPADRIIYLTGTERVKVHWGSFSQVQATLNMATSVLRRGTDVDRVCLLSGSDFPIKSPDVIRSTFESDIEFLRVDRLLNATQPKDHFDRRIRYLFFEDLPLLKRVRASGRIPQFAAPEIPVYHGSSWWSLTAPCMRHIVDFVKSHPRFVRLHRFSYCPDETFFGSIVKASEFAPRLSQDFERRPAVDDDRVHGCHYIDWSGGGANPRTLTLADRQAVAQSRALFARKFNLRLSAELLNTLDPTLHDASPPAQGSADAI